jgi:hypothetical protein
MGDSSVFWILGGSENRRHPHDAERAVEFDNTPPKILSVMFGSLVETWGTRPSLQNHLCNRF